MKSCRDLIYNSNNYIFDFNTAVDIDKVDRDVLLKLHNALVLLFKKDNIPEIKSHISPNQTNILEQIEEVEDLKEDIN